MAGIRLQWHAAIALLAFLWGGRTLPAQTALRETAPAELRQAIVRLDSALFAAYNRCDLEAFGALLSPDIEFYHDQGGLTVGAMAIVDAVRQNICGKATRQIVPGTMEVHVMHGYGALQLATHRFYRAGDEARGPVGEARLVHLWKQEGGAWRITRIISFDHHTLPVAP